MGLVNVKPETTGQILLLASTVLTSAVAYWIINSRRYEESTLDDNDGLDVDVEVPTSTQYTIMPPPERKTDTIADYNLVSGLVAQHPSLVYRIVGQGGKINWQLQFWRRVQHN